VASTWEIDGEHVSEAQAPDIDEQLLHPPERGHPRGRLLAGCANPGSNCSVSGLRACRD